MSKTLKLTGGGQIGWMNATWPFMRLTASSEKLALSSPLLGSYIFSANDIISLKPYGWLPIVGRGVQIVHTNINYPAKIIFWCLGNPERLIQKIHALGFQSGSTLLAPPQRSGIPLRWSFIITVVVMWNVLFLMDGLKPWDESGGPGIYVFLALLILLLTSIAALRFTTFQSIITKPGRSISEFKPVFNLLIFISGFMLVALVIQYLLEQ